MRLFYDTYTHRARAELVLFATDTVATCAALYYLSAAFHPGSSGLDIAWLAVWSATPRAVAKILAWVRRPEAVARNVFITIPLALIIALLLVTGIEVMDAVMPVGERLNPLEFGSMLLAWGTGFFLFYPRAYRLQDFALCAVVLVAAAAGRPMPFVWIPVFLFALFLSAAARHLLFNVFPERQRTLINLQNARAVAVLGGVAASAVFLALSMPFYRDDWRRYASAGYHREGSGGGRSVTATDARGNLVTNVANSTDDTSVPITGVGPPQGRVGFSYQVELRDLVRPRYDASIVLRARLRGPDPDDLWPPRVKLLWRGATFAEYDGRTESWKEASTYTAYDWPPTGVVQMKQEIRKDRRPITLECEVVNPVMASLIIPYHAVAVESRNFRRVLTSDAATFFPVPQMRRGTRYGVHCHLLASDPHALLNVDAKPHANARYLSIPPASQLGFDLKKFAREKVFASTGTTIRAKYEALRRFFESSRFKYSTVQAWQAGRNPLWRFLTQERIGNCTYFGTAATLLLRASGVSTRLAAGFLGGHWDPQKEEVIVRNLMAHTWTEIYIPGRGWFPLDATGWVGTDASNVPPPETPEGLLELAEVREAANFGDLDAPGGSEGVPPGGNRRRLRTPGLSPSIDLQNPETAEVEDPSMWPTPGQPRQWVQFGNLTRAMEQLTGGELRLGSGVTGPDGDDWYDELTRQASAAEMLRERRSSSSAMRFLRKWKPVLRAVLLACGLIAGGLVIMTFLRPARVEEDDEEKSDEELLLDEQILRSEQMAAEAGVPAQRVIRSYWELQLALLRTRSHRERHETPIEHAARVARQRPELQKLFLAIHRLFYDTLYGKTSPSDVDTDAMEKHCRRAQRMLG